MAPISIVTLLALAQFVLFAMQVGSMRGKYGINAPAVSGDPQFERMFRVHQNTMEQLVVFIPALWIYGYLVNPKWGAAIGLVYIVGRFVYRAEYLKDPNSRSLGFALSFTPIAVLLIWALVAAVKTFL